MALPPLRPQRTTAGIVVDPGTLERVVPSSKRSDGTTRKELKIRPGFTPQEDVGRFRPSRQVDSKPAFIPGTNRVRPTPPSNPDNPFAQQSAIAAAAKSKAQLKNEKRREKKKSAPASTSKDWDASDDEGEDDDALREAFEKGDKERAGAVARGDGDKDVVYGDDFPELGGGGGAPKPPLLPGTKDDDSLGAGAGAGPGAGGEATTAILSPPPPGPDTVPGQSSSQPPPPPIISPTPTSSVPKTKTRASRPSPAEAEPPSNASATRKPHPIQGGRQGPIGLANPPPANANPNSRLKKGGQKAPAPPGSGSKFSSSATVEKNVEPRVRKEVKVRDTAGSLADRVRGLVIANQQSSPSRKKETSGTAASTSTDP